MYYCPQYSMSSVPCTVAVVGVVTWSRGSIPITSPMFVPSHHMFCLREGCLKFSCVVCYVALPHGTTKLALRAPHLTAGERGATPPPIETLTSIYHFEFVEELPCT